MLEIMDRKNAKGDVCYKISVQTKPEVCSSKEAGRRGVKCVQYHLGLLGEEPCSEEPHPFPHSRSIADWGYWAGVEG